MSQPQLPPLIEQEVSASLAAWIAGTPYWLPLAPPTELVVVLREVIDTYKAVQFSRNVALALADKPGLSQEALAAIRQRVSIERLPDLCPWLLPEDRKAVLVLLDTMLIAATRRIVRRPVPLNTYPFSMN